MRRLRVVLVLAALASVAPARADHVSREPQVVVALIDTGINPYSPAFRDDSPLAQRYPGEYLPGYPPDAEPLTLALEPPDGVDPKDWTFEKAYARDKEVWDRVEIIGQRQLWWVPGTKIVGLMSFGSGGIQCRPTPPIPPTTYLVNFGCREHVLLDDHGHGTMAASRATSRIHSLGAQARVVMLEGSGASAMTYASLQPWIDVQSNSWGSLAPAVPAPTGTTNPYVAAAKRQFVLFASGNGLGFLNGFAPQPTWVEPTAAPGIILVGAHDNGRVSAWSEAPAHVVADGYGGWAGIANSLDEPRPDPIACCTSAAAPYAAGGAAAILLEARRILADDGTVARAPGQVAVLTHNGTKPASGPLSDGDLTLTEWRALYLATAQARPVQGDDDGLLHFTGGPGVPQHPEYGPGENPFCIGCWTLPIHWTDIPADVPAYASIGYGAINEFAIALAAEVLSGKTPMPARPAEDAFFAQDESIRRTYHGG